MLSRPVLALALAGTVLLATACSGAASSEGAATPSVSPSSVVTSEVSATAVPESESPESPAPESSAASSAPSKPSAADMDTDRLADAVLEQLKIDSPDTFSDQLVTIALSPLMRQLASTADVTTRVASKGERVTLTLTGDDGTCVITVTDEPRARGVVCKQA